MTSVSEQRDKSTLVDDAIAIERLTKHYGQRRVDVVNLNIPTGCVYGLLGRNGAGKSTLIKMLLGMVHPDAGRATLLGEDVRNLSPNARKRIAYLAEGHPLYRGMTVGQIVDFSRPFYDTWRDSYIHRVLEHFRIPLRQRVGKLSNGQRAQVSLALALGPDPELLILDDPTLGLDTVVRRDFLESIIHLIQRSGRTILFSSHILADVERVADRIGIICDGVLRVDCGAEHFKNSVRRVVLEFNGAVPRFPDCSGLVNQWRVGNRLELLVVNYGPEHTVLAEDLGATSIDVLEMNLEDAFVAYTRDTTAPPLPDPDWDAQR